MIRLCLVLLALFAGMAPSARAQETSIIAFRGSDMEMNAAIAKARNSLDLFWKAYEKPGPGEEGFSLKVRIAVGDPSGTDGEHIWMDRIERLADGRLAGRLANQPRQFKGKPGERRVFGSDQVSDWLFMRNGKFVGMETMRPMLKKMPKEQADAFRQRMESP